MARTSIVDREAAHFGGLASDWWDPERRLGDAAQAEPGPALLHPRHGRPAFRAGRAWLQAARGKTALDVGCGAGLLAEPLARLGAKVTAVDAAPELIEVAKAHAAGQGLDIDYRAVGVEAVEGRFDLITAMEVIEHVADPQAFVDDLRRGWRRAGC